MEPLEVGLGILILLLSYLGPVLKKVFLKRAGVEPQAEGPGAEADTEELLWELTEAESEEIAPLPLLLQTPVPQPPAQSGPPEPTPVRRRPQPSKTKSRRRSPPQPVAPAGRRLDAALVKQAILLDAFLTTPRALTRR